MGRDAPAMRGKVGALGFYWVTIGLEKGGVLWCGPWAAGAWGQEAAVCSNVIFCLWLSGAVSSVLAFQ